MEAKREVHALDYAICVVIHQLNEKFRARGFSKSINGWSGVEKGLCIKVLRQDENSVEMHVHCVGQVERNILYLHFILTCNGWHLKKGKVESGHSAVELSGMTFHGERDDSIRFDDLERFVRILERKMTT